MYTALPNGLPALPNDLPVLLSDLPVFLSGLPALLNEWPVLPNSKQRLVLASYLPRLKRFKGLEKRKKVKLFTLVEKQLVSIKIEPQAGETLYSKKHPTSLAVPPEKHQIRRDASRRQPMH